MFKESMLAMAICTAFLGSTTTETRAASPDVAARRPSGVDQNLTNLDETNIQDCYFVSDTSEHRGEPKFDFSFKRLLDMFQRAEANNSLGKFKEFLTHLGIRVSGTIRYTPDIYSVLLRALYARTYP